MSACGCLRPDREQLWRICAVFFGFFGLLVAKNYTKIDRTSNREQLWRICAVFFGFFPCLLTPGVDADETMFKGVQIMHITLGLADFRATAGTYPSHQRCCAATLRVR
jgi:hypothetical protein